MAIISEQTTDKKRQEQLAADPRSETTTHPPSPITEANSPPRRWQKQGRWLLLFFVLILVGAGLWLARNWVMETFTFLTDQEAVSNIIQNYGPLGPIVLAFFQLIQVIIAIIPGHIFLIAAGYVYGFPVGLFFNITFTVAASQFAFYLARKAGEPVVRRLVDENTLRKWYTIGEKQGFLFFTISFVLPVFPNDAMNFVGGLSGINSRKFLAANFLGRLPSAIMLTLIGSHGLQFSTGAWVGMIVFVILLYVVGRYVMVGINRRYAQSEHPE